MSITLDSSGIAIVSEEFKKLLPKVWQAIQLNYFHDSYKNIYSSASKLQRFWRMASGFHNGYELIEPYDFNTCLLPPILFRQSHECQPEVMYGEIPYYRENGISMTRNTRTNPWNNLTTGIDDPITCYKQRIMISKLKIINGWVCKNTPKRFNKRTFEPMMTKEHIYTLAKKPYNIHRNPYKKICCCTDPKAADYISAFKRNKKYILKIFSILAKDTMNVKTRMKLSNFLRYRLFQTI